MKQLSIEEKVLAYEQAIEALRSLFAEQAIKHCDRVNIKDITNIFPELKESEDERIRGNIIATIHLYYGEPLEDEAKEMTAWLEKQGEHAKFCDSIQVGDKVTRNEDGVLVNLSQLKRVAKPADKQGEQKPAWSEEDRKTIDNLISQLGNLFVRKLIKEETKDKYVTFLKSLKDRVQPKQEWSEEDKEFINDLIGIFDGQQYQAHSDEEIVKWLKSIRLPYNKEWDENNEEMLKSIIATCELACEDRDSSPARHLLQMQTDWLKSLKDRIQPQPKQEWSKENKKMLEYTIDMIEWYVIDKSKTKRVIDWLKSLRPQNTWKPSDEQIKAIRLARSFVVDDFCEHPTLSEILMELEEQLKKLKG